FSVGAPSLQPENAKYPEGARVVDSLKVNDVKQASLFIVREAMLEAKRRGLKIVIYFHKSKFLHKVLESKSENFNWRLQPVSEDIKFIPLVYIEALLWSEFNSINKWAQLASR
ncbi:hypothetical protein Goklo_011081, partial [Gossypium klotzschianum]|nr:hypothetical protein [Gossypium klotzschianum]